MGGHAEAVAADEAYGVAAGLVGRTFATERALQAEVPALTAAQKKRFAAACAVADPQAPVVMRAGKPERDPDLRHAENVPLPAGWLALTEAAREESLVASAEQHLTDEIQPYVPDAWTRPHQDHGRLRDPVHPEVLGRYSNLRPTGARLARARTDAQRSQREQPWVSPECNGRTRARHDGLIGTLSRSGMPTNTVPPALVSLVNTVCRRRRCVTFLLAAAS